MDGDRKMEDTFEKESENNTSIDDEDVYSGTETVDTETDDNMKDKGEWMVKVDGKKLKIKKNKKLKSGNVHKKRKLHGSVVKK